MLKLISESIYYFGRHRSLLHHGTGDVWQPIQAGTKRVSCFCQLPGATRGPDKHGQSRALQWLHWGWHFAWPICLPSGCSLPHPAAVHWLCCRCGNFGALTANKQILLTQGAPAIVALVLMIWAH